MLDRNKNTENYVVTVEQLRQSTSSADALVNVLKKTLPADAMSLKVSTMSDTTVKDVLNRLGNILSCIEDRAVEYHDCVQ